MLLLVGYPQDRFFLLYNLESYIILNTVSNFLNYAIALPSLSLSLLSLLFEFGSESGKRHRIVGTMGAKHTADPNGVGPGGSKFLISGWCGSTRALKTKVA